MKRWRISEEACMQQHPELNRPANISWNRIIS